MKTLIDKLAAEHTLTHEEFVTLIEMHNQPMLSEYLFEKAVAERKKHYGYTVYLRGLIEFTNYCKNDCLYCGIRRSNRCLERYRLSEDEILSCCDSGYSIGFRTFVLQGGEDSYYTPERTEALIRKIKTRYPDCALTLSVGEQPRKVYESWFKAGADRYLLRHETADFEHYGKLHPKELTLENRLDCLKNLKEIGYQVGCGFMVGSPFQTAETLARDLELISEFRPHMVGVGPFIPQKDTPFGKYPAGSFRLTLFLLGVIRLLLPDVLLPATTALGSIHPNGRELGILAGANVCMPNLSPEAVRSKYALYDNKLSSGSEAAANVKQLAMTMSEIGYSVSLERGDHASIN